VKSKSYNSKKKPRLKTTISLHTAAVPGSRSIRAEMLLASADLPNEGETDAPRLSAVKVSGSRGPRFTVISLNFEIVTLKSPCLPL
jgi:hypothetical protein